MDIAGSLYPTGRIGTTNYILTPENIVNDMINMFPDDFWTPDIKVLDIFSKSGRFLMAAYKKLFNSPYLADMDIAKRKHHILSEQLYGITDDFTCLMLSERMLYGYAQYGKKKYVYYNKEENDCYFLGANGMECGVTHKGMWDGVFDGDWEGPGFE